LGGDTPHCQPNAGEAEDDRQDEHGGKGCRQDADVDPGDVRTEQPDRPRREWRGKRPRVGVPEPQRDAVEQEEQADGDNQEGKVRGLMGRPDDHPLDAGTQGNGDHEGDGKAQPIGHADLRDERPRDERGEGGHLTLGEVEHAGRSVDQHQGQRHRTVDAADRETTGDLLGVDHGVLSGARPR